MLAAQQDVKFKRELQMMVQDGVVNVQVTENVQEHLENVELLVSFQFKFKKIENYNREGGLFFHNLSLFFLVSLLTTNS